MNPSLLPLLEKHFAWSAEFSLSLDISPEIQIKLESHLSNIETLLHLKPLQFFNLITKKRLDSLISYLTACHQVCTDLNEMSETFNFIQFNVHLEILLSCQFTHHQIENFDKRSYLSLEYIEKLSKKLRYCALAHQIVLQIHQARHNNHHLLASNTSIIENHEVDEEVIEVLLELPTYP